MLANLSGIKVIGAKDIKQHIKNSYDSRVSITALRLGSAAGTTGLMIFLANDETMMSRSLSDYNLIYKHDAPPESTFIMTPSGYMTDKVWEKLPALALGIRQMLVTRDHPIWRVCMTLNELGSHVSVHSALKIFS
jgi:hypothetical protein